MVLVWQSLLKNTKISAITLFPFIILRQKRDLGNAVLLNHEKIHLRQQLELLILFFYLWYGLEYYYHLFRLRDRFLAYRAISFEREAYAMEHDLQYLENRRFWNFRKYL